MPSVRVRGTTKLLKIEWLDVCMGQNKPLFGNTKANQNPIGYFRICYMNFSLISMSEIRGLYDMRDWLSN